MLGPGTLHTAACRMRQEPTSEASVHCHMACRRCTRATSGAVCILQLLLASLAALPPPMGGPGAEGRGVGSASALVTSWLRLSSLQGMPHVSRHAGHASRFS